MKTRPKGQAIADRLIKRLNLPKSARPAINEAIGDAMILGLESLAETMREVNAKMSHKKTITLTSRPS